MAWIRHKNRQKGHSAGYYLVESRRTGPNKQPREHILQYIGTIENLVTFATNVYNASQKKAASSESNKNDASVSLDELFNQDLTITSYMHGACMALLWVAQFLGIEKIFDNVFPPKAIHGMKRSRVLLLAIIYYAVHPGSKAAFSSWVKTTSLPHELQLNPDNLDSQAFWTAMDGITVDMIKEANELIVKRMMQILDIKLDVMNLDYTNYFTFVSSKNNRCFICRRGHNKQKRDDLRQFSLAMLTTQILNIPLIWDLYEGNKNDLSEFPDFINTIKEELKKLDVDLSEITLVFDGGSVSTENIKKLDMHYICACTVGDAAYLEDESKTSLFDIDLDQYQAVQLENGHERLAYRIDNLTYAGVNGTGILTFSQDLYDGKIAELEKTTEKLNKLLDEVNQKLRTPKSRLVTQHENKRRKRESERKAIDQYNEGLDRQRALLKANGESTAGLGRKKPQEPEWNDEEEMQSTVEKNLFCTRKLSALKNFASVSLRKEKNHYQATLTIDEDSKRAYCRKYYGKKLTVTDRIQWSTERILSEYAGQECIENGIFRLSKNTEHFSVTPQHHWTDDKIRVHVFICMLSLTLAEVLRMKLEEADVKVSTTAILDLLALVRKAVIMRGVPSEKGETDVHWQIERIENPQVQKVWDAVQKIIPHK